MDPSRSYIFQVTNLVDGLLVAWRPDSGGSDVVLREAACHRHRKRSPVVARDSGALDATVVVKNA